MQCITIFNLESILERRFGKSLKKLHAECESLQRRCTRSKRDLREARLQISLSQQDLLDDGHPDQQFEDDVFIFCYAL